MLLKPEEIGKTLRFYCLYDAINRRDSLNNIEYLSSRYTNKRNTKLELETIRIT
jgi:hypothetical protein